MNTPALISIALCTYNGERYLKEQIDSILAQTYHHIEIVVVDDCSSDNTVSLLEGYSKQVNLRYYINETNQGFIKNFERAIGLCQGDYILPCDQDDVWEPHKIQTLLDAIQGHLLAYSNAKLVDEHLEPLDKMLCDDSKISCFEGSNSKAFVYRNCISGNTMMFTKKLKEFALPFPNTIQFHDVWIAFCAASHGAIAYVNEPLVLYRQHAHNITDVTKNRKQKKSASQKREAKYASYQKRIGVIESYAYYQHLTPDNKRFFETLLALVKNSEKCYFNFKLAHFLYKHRHQLYAIDKSIKLTHLMKDAYGMKLYQCLPFI